MEKNELKDLLGTIMDKNKSQMEAFQAETFVELKGNKDEILDLMENMKVDVATVQNHVDKFETSLEKSKINVGLNMNDNIFNSINTKDYTNMVDKKVQGGGIDFSFDIPLITNASVILDPDSFIAGNAPVVLPFREMGIDKSPVRPPMVSDLIQWGTTSSNMVDWIERSGKTNGAAMRAEGGVMGQGDVTYKEVSTKVKIISEYMKVTNESLKDASFLASEINSELLSDIGLLVDTQLLSGDGTGSNLKGIDEYAATWTGGTFTGTITAPNIADVLRTAINQIYVAGNGKWFPSAILMHPTDLATLDLLKIADGRYIDIPYYDGEKQSVVKVPIYQNVGISAGNFLVADFSKAKGFVRDSLTIRIFDQNENDPIYNRSTITGNVRLAFRIKNQEADAFVKGNFATAILALTA